MKIFKWFWNKIVENIIVIIGWVFASTTIVGIFYSIYDSIISWIIELLPKTIFLIFMIGIVSIIFNIIFFLPTLIRPKLIFVKENGLYKDYKGNFYCASCLNKNKKRVPVRTDYSNDQIYGWRCMMSGCHQFYSNQSYQEPVQRENNRRI